MTGRHGQEDSAETRPCPTITNSCVAMSLQYFSILLLLLQCRGQVLD